MNMTADCPCETEDDVFRTIDIALITIATIETLLSFTPDHYPKSIVQLLMFVVYQSYRTAARPRKPIEQPDVEAQSMHNSIRSWKSWVSVNVGR